MRNVFLGSLLCGFMTTSLIAQFKPAKLPEGMSLLGEDFIELVVKQYSIEKQPFTKVLKDLAHRFGVQFSVEIAASREFTDPPITLQARDVSLKELFNQVINAGHFEEAEWGTHPSLADRFYIEIGGSHRGLDYPLDLRLEKWSAPPDMSPVNVLSNFLGSAPRLRRRFYGDGGTIGSLPPYVTFGCRVVYQAENESVRQILENLARIGNLSWVFIYVAEDERRSRLMVF
ncbi:MAG: hypothetical protein Kow001_19190 [Acidobacteriota bacterium]